jgi:hypothetical protein
VSLENSCVLLQWLCTTGSECVSLDSSCVLVVDYRVVSGLIDETSWKYTSLDKREC